MTAGGENLETERLILRRWRAGDLDAFARINSDPAVMEFFPAPLTRDDTAVMVQRIEAHFAEYGFGLWAAELRTSAELTGFVGLTVPRFKADFMPCVEIGWRLAPAHWGQGLATEGARQVLRHAFGALGLKEIVSFTAEGNHRSRRVMEKLGMSHDVRDDFDHPYLAAGHPLRRHVLYRIGHER